MSENWPPIDLHAHIDPSIEASDLIALQAVVFVATRSLAEFNRTRRRRDPITIWGVGAHPALPEALQHFSAIELHSAIRSTPLVSEVGMDASSPASRAQQTRVLGEILAITKDEPRIVSIHSAGATSWVLDALADHPQKGAVLHWWRGQPGETARAVELGCFFSVNKSELKRPTVIGRVPWDRLLLETDHPYGDRGSGAAPGMLKTVERAIAGELGVLTSSVRMGLWGNLARLVNETGTANLFGDRVQRMLSVAPKSLSSSPGAQSP